MILILFFLWDKKEIQECYLWFLHEGNLVKKIIFKLDYIDSLLAITIVSNKNSFLKSIIKIISKKYIIISFITFINFVFTIFVDPIGVRTRREWIEFLFIIFHCIPFEVWGTPSLTMKPGYMGREAAGGMASHDCWWVNNKVGDGLPRKIAAGRKKRGGGWRASRSFFSGGSQTPGEGKELWE